MPERARRKRNLEKPIRFTQSPAFVRTYANNAQLEVSNWDFRLIFGEVTGREGETLCVEQRVAVAMSPQHTKALLELLTRHVAAYEERVGQIRWQQASK